MNVFVGSAMEKEALLARVEITYYPHLLNSEEIHAIIANTSNLIVNSIANTPALRDGNVH